jgi:hypothetical protein
MESRPYTYPFDGNLTPENTVPRFSGKDTDAARV